MPKVNRLHLFIILILTITLVAACNSDAEAVQSEPTEAEPIVEEEEMEEPDQEEENSEVEIEESETIEVGGKTEEVYPITIKQELWNTRRETAYEIVGEIGPIIRDGDLQSCLFYWIRMVTYK